MERVGTIGERPVDTRIIAATNQKLSDLVSRGRFRLDLYYRLHGVEIDVPPLRARPDDIIELAEYFLARHREFRRLRLSAASADALLAYQWPGNVRELERVIERGGTRRLRPIAARRPARVAPRRLCRSGRPIVPTVRVDADLGQPVRTHGVRALREQQTPDVPGTRDLLPHLAGVPPVGRSSDVRREGARAAAPERWRDLPRRGSARAH